MFTWVDTITKRQWIFYLFILSEEQKNSSKSIFVSATNTGKDSNSVMLSKSSCQTQLLLLLYRFFFFFFVNKKKIVLILHEIILFSIALFFNLQLLCDFNKGSNISLCVNTLLLVFFIHLIVKKNSSLSKVIHYYNQRPFFFNLSRFFLIRLAPFPHFEKLLCFRRNGALIL